MSATEPAPPAPEARPRKPPPSPEILVSRLLHLLDVEELDTDLYRGACQPGGRGRVFGGQVIAQALTAAIRSTDPALVAHSLHAYFMRPGDEEMPIIYRVVRDFEGRSFATRRIIALQRGKPILNMAASFQRPEPGLAHQAEMPKAPAPETLVSEAEAFRSEAEREGLPERVREIFTRARPIEVRPVEARSLARPVKREPRFMSWFRAAAPVGDDPNVHRAILAFASDMSLLGTSMLPHGVSWVSHGMQTASLDHALWLHEDLRVDDWLLYVTDSPWSGHARGFNRGQIFSRDGRLVASVAQEGLIRLREG
jgi:acyl-CoA thioesterase II